MSALTSIKSSGAAGCPARGLVITRSWHSRSRSEQTAGRGATSLTSWRSSRRRRKRAGKPAEVPVSLEVHGGIFEPVLAQARAEGDHGPAFTEQIAVADARSW